MTITGYQFDKMKVTPEADAMLYHALANRQNCVITGVGSDLSATATGLNVYLNPGASIVCGRLLTVTNQETLTVQANTSGYICQTIDLTETNTATGTPGSGDYIVANNQYRLEVVNELTQQDLMKDGQIYTFPLYSFVSNGTAVTITKVVDSFPKSNDTGWQGLIGSRFPEAAKYRIKDGVLYIRIVDWNPVNAGGLIGSIPTTYGFFQRSQFDVGQWSTILTSKGRIQLNGSTEVVEPGKLSFSAYTGGDTFSCYLPPIPLGK